MIATGCGWHLYRLAREKYLRGLFPLEATILVYRDWIETQGHDEDHGVALMKREIERLQCLWMPAAK